MEYKYCFNLVAAKIIIQRKQLAFFYMKIQIYKLELEKHFMIVNIGFVFVVTASTIFKVSNNILEQMVINIAFMITILQINDLFYCNNLINYKSFTIYTNLIMQKIIIIIMITFVAGNMLYEIKGLAFLYY